MLGSAPDLFAYPYGCWNERVAATVRSAGYRAARALGDGIANGGADVYALHSVLATDDMAAFERDVRGPGIAARLPSGGRPHGLILSAAR